MTVDLEDRLRRTLAAKAAQVTDVAPLVAAPAPAPRRRWPLTLAAAATVLVAALAAVLVADRDAPDDRPASTVPPVPATVPASWGGPVGMVAGDGRLFVHFDAHTGAGEGGLATFDPASGEVTPLAELDRGSAVAYGDGALWAFSPAARQVARLDPETGTEVRTSAALEGLGAGGYRMAVGAQTIWMVPYDWSSPVSVLDVETLVETVGGHVDRPSTGPVVVDDVAYVGSEVDGLQRVDAAGEVQPTGVPGRITDVAAGDGGLWVTTGDSTWLASEVSWVPLDGGEPVGQGTLALEGGVTAIGVVDDRVCLHGENALDNPTIRCASQPAPGDPVTVDASREDGGWAWGDLVELDGQLWGADADDGVIRRIDPETARTTRVAEVQALDP